MCVAKCVNFKRSKMHAKCAHKMSSDLDEASLQTARGQSSVTHFVREQVCKQKASTPSPTSLTHASKLQVLFSQISCSLYNSAVVHNFTALCFALFALFLVSFWRLWKWTQIRTMLMKQLTAKHLKSWCSTGNLWIGRWQNRASVREVLTCWKQEFGPIALLSLVFHPLSE